MSVPLFPIDQEKLSRVLKSEFELWAHDFDQSPIPEARDLRAFFIQWFAVFAPECFEGPLVNRIATFTNEMRQYTDARRLKWYALLPIEIALSPLSSNPFWLEYAKPNLNHHNSGLRRSVLESLLLVVDRLRFDDPHLLAPVRDNLERRHMGAKNPVIFLCMAQGEPEMKRTQIKQWLDQVNMNSHDRETLQALTDGEFVPNPFLHHVTQVACYILLRLASEETLLEPSLSAESQSSVVPDELGWRLPIARTKNPSDLGLAIWQQMDEHPLFQPFIRLEQVET